ncbi:succinyl-CoA--D-citramalate CoA-transferase [Stella humosa]|uniref:Succinyl-CoA--D-citramalate CoA-transferase n=1 Tax=Stella humosa TaxID=94 RepID=A0A3N1LCS9_9PROT|nr:CoA transferase [Stella humosa]ROP90851.1 succinyl-CoA--D-citramalate CoA-transferase [Stella humosa]BBK34800.1 CoA transferase [Stella humosa]
MPDTGTSRASDLSTITVIEAAGTPAGAFAASLFADFGGRVIVCEPPGGSPIRHLGSAVVRRVWWPIVARNKQSLALDPDAPGGAEIAARLLEQAQVLVRDDGSAASWQAAATAGTKPPLDLSLHAPGRDRPDLWPWSTAPQLAAAATGAVALTGQPDGPAMQAEFPLADYTAGLLAAAGALCELRAAGIGKRTAAPLAFGMHEALLRMNEWQLAVASITGQAEPRNGNRFPMNSNIGNVFRTQDGRLLTVSAATPSVADRLLVMIGGPALRDDPRFRTTADRQRNMDALDAVIAEWMARHDSADAMRLVRENDVVVGPLYDAGDVLADPHLAARADVAWVDDGTGEALPQPAILPKIAGMGATIRHAGPAIGADSDAVLGAAGFTAEEIAGFRRSGAVWL